jgi:polygalacturonase
MNNRFSFSKFYLLLAILITSQTLSAQDTPWRSELYPFDWQSGYKVKGKFLHDFSYAGYHKGEIPIPKMTEKLVDVTKAPFLADNTGASDATNAIQLAIDSVAKLNGGIVYIPEGTYHVSPGSSNALLVSADGTIIRGAGVDKTFILNTATNMRSKTILEFSPGSNGWYNSVDGEIKFTKDAVENDTIVYIANASHFKVGDLIILTSDFTAAFIEEHKMTGKWNSSIEGTAFARRIEAVNTEANSIEVDIPIR